ncbi:Murein DD-endopeptidase MepM and murein hydrolase activator NlpD, contain LysM domain [Roseospirillum parvum]|uniref:Murein DD-endopeptidase MepM and murein hydrolase activator NlpD, contain LysM domain n=2 Tax=Roseospirillum parvum TaxID=83401 RepID=A0A1G7Y471_9PROT|nr:Murein DD-endopeptidase MepM and murein hydrolase activator NlpD, contain LysM domain [Roseospirillum parvum]
MMILLPLLLATGCTPYYRSADDGASAGQVAAPAARAASLQRTARLSGGGTVTVGPGDTLYGLAGAHDVPSRALIEANRLDPPYLLTVGQRLELPRLRLYRVQAGDTLFAIARDFGVEMHALARLNDITPPYVIRVGRDLILSDRAAGSVAGAAAAPEPVASTSLPPPATTPDNPPAQRPAEPAFAAPSDPVAAATPPPPPPRQGGRFLWPIEGGEVISRFGSVGGGLFNDGINIAAPAGTPIRAIENATVVYAGNELKGFGNLVLLKHADGWMSAYAHARQVLVAKGATVQRGEIIARVGQSGNVDTPQLHFELRQGSRPVDPESRLAAARG